MGIFGASCGRWLLSIEIHTKWRSTMENHKITIENQEKALLDSLKAWLIRNYGDSLLETFAPNKPFHRLRPEWHKRFLLRGALLPWIEEESGLSLFYPDELRANTRPLGLVRILIRKLDKAVEPLSPGTGAPARTVSKSPITEPTVFVLGAPRSGTTLLRSMLMGHPDLWAGPELLLLEFESMRGREREIIDSQAVWKIMGLAQNIAGMKHWPIARAFQEVTRMTAYDWPVVEVYRFLHSINPKRFLVDKSPSLTLSPATLAKIESHFSNAYHIFITRHPVPVVESRVRMGLLWGNDPCNAVTAQEKWLRHNVNAIQHLRAVRPDRKRQIKYEDLVRDPKSVLSSICDMLNIPFAPGMENPYAGGRLLEGIGCPNLPKRSQVDPKLAESWKWTDHGIELNEETSALAAALGY